LRYIYLAANRLLERDPNEIVEDVIDHLKGASHQLVHMWGQAEFNRLKQTEDRFNPRVWEGLKQELPDETIDELKAVPLNNWNEEQTRAAIKVNGWLIMNSIYRQLLLQVISELWVDYLTKVEALRVSIGLEAYAQRDPLVQYKGRASEMFSELLRDIRTGVINRIFVYRPRIAAPTSPDATPAEATATQQPAPTPSSNKKKRHRH
jgi:preprotein translocase subunit SecA